MRTALICLGALLACASYARTLDILIGGSKVGENLILDRPDGTIESQVNLTVMGTKITSELYYLIGSDGKVKRHRFLESSGPNKVEGSYDGLNLRAVANGKALPVKQAPKHSPPYYSNLHPVVLSTLKGKLEKTSGTLTLTNVTDLSALPAAYEWTVLVVPVGDRMEAITMVKITLAGTVIKCVLSADFTVRGIQVPAQLLTMQERGWENIFADPVAKSKELSQLTHTVETTSKIMAPMRDGIQLAATVSLPKGAGKSPTILVRTPYGREGTMYAYSHFAQRGFNVVVQDTRGKGDSQGKFDPFMGEIEDGYDTLEWITKQPWSDGSVGMIGGSYLGYVQWAAAMSKHPALKCIIPQVSPPEPTRNVPWDHGAFMLQPNLWWANIVRGQNADLSTAATLSLDPKALYTLPLSRADDVFFGRNLPFFDSWLKRPRLEDWKGAITQKGIGEVKIPVMHVSGTWDGDGIGTLLNWQSQRDNGGNQWMIFGPWPHGFNVSTTLGDVDFGPNSVIDLTTLEVRFFDQFLKKKAVEMEKVPRVKIFATGTNQWFSDRDLPLTFTRKRTVYLAGNSGKGFKSSGVLTEHVPAPGKDSYAYHPAKSKVLPVSSNIGSVRESDFPGEMLSYRTAKFPKSTLVTGPFEVKLHAFTTVRDATFFAFLAEESANGTHRMLGQPGKMRTTFATGGPISPNRTVELDVQPWLFAHVLKSGSRLVLFITSDMFPIFARNPGTGEPDFSATKLLSAVHTVRRGKGAPSSLTYYAYSW